uniref:Transposase MuDR plant domain-containing protein n=1 Tax=Cannabis sativa TaxID=3483 RepID=A0A803P500_CANSA
MVKSTEMNALQVQYADKGTVEGFGQDVAGTKADACPWRIHASLSPNERLFIIKTFNNTHTCQCVRTNRATNSGWIAKKMVGPISRHPDMSLKGMREELKDTWGIEVNNKRLWRARAIARGEVEGNHVQSYGKLRRYAFMVMQTNPGSAAIIQSQLVDINKPSEEVEEEVPPKSRVPIWRPQFQRIFICYNGVKQGFLVGCRPFFGLDGCHLKALIRGSYFLP